MPKTLIVMGKMGNIDRERMAEIMREAGYEVVLVDHLNSFELPEINPKMFLPIVVQPEIDIPFVAGLKHNLSSRMVTSRKERKKAPPWMRRK